MGCKYLTETKEALDCSKKKVLPPPLASFYFQRYSKVHWVARTDFIVKHGNVQWETIQVRKEQWNTEKRTVAWTLKSHRAEQLKLHWRPAWPRVLCLCLSPAQDVSQCPCCLQAPNQWFPKQTEAATALASWKQQTRQQGYYCCKNQITSSIGSF